jgi:ParB family transcriptional regulator, chromosome partitioning protein
MPTPEKITLSSSRDIPFNKLVLSQSNVRTIKAGVSVEELAEDIARRTLLQSLNVRPVLDDDGNETGTFEIPAGGRRYRALALLVKQKRLAKTALIPCVVRDPKADILAEDDSLAENIQRAPLHPLDQFRAFQAMRDKGQSEEDIAAAFFTIVNVVKQRLRLAAVSPKLLEIYAEDGMTLEQLMAFTIAPDHKRQEKVWNAIEKHWSKEPYIIRRMLTEKSVRADDKRAVFVTVDAYEAAGGTILTDLFDDKLGGWLEDVPLLERLVAEKLRVGAETIAGEGWKWIEVQPTFPYGHNHALAKIEGVLTDLTDEEQARIAALKAEYAKLEAEYEQVEELPDEVDARLGEIENALTVYDDRPVTYDPADVARAGVFISIDSDGTLCVERGYVRPEDEPQFHPTGEGEAADPPVEGAEGADPADPTIRRTVITVGGQPVEGEDEDDVVKPLPERLMMELTAHRTLALRDAVACHPDVAMMALLHKLVLDTFEHSPSNGACLEASVRHVYFPAQLADLKDSSSAKSIDARQEAWQTDIPQDENALWDWLQDLSGDHRMTLLAHCVSFGVNALYEKPNQYGSGVSPHGLTRRFAQADRLARAVGLDMADAGWRPTVENYLGRVPKRRILEAVREGAGDRAAQLIDHLKKGDMAKEAERLLADTAWLPKPLRLVDDAPKGDVAEGERDALPAFLSGDDDGAGDEPEEPQPVAAE